MSDCRFFDRMQIVFLFAFNRFVCFVIVGEIEGIFARTRMSFRDYFLPLRDNRWLVKDFLMLRLQLNDVPVFHENLFEIRCGRIVGSNTVTSLLFVLFCCKQPFFLSVNLTSVTIS